MDLKKAIIVLGNPISGFEFVGPFDNVHLAQQWAEKQDFVSEWWIWSPPSSEEYEET